MDMEGRSMTVDGRESSSTLPRASADETLRAYYESNPFSALNASWDGHAPSAPAESVSASWSSMWRIMPPPRPPPPALSGLFSPKSKRYYLMHSDRIDRDYRRSSGHMASTSSGIVTYATSSLEGSWEGPGHEDAAPRAAPPPAPTPRSKAKAAAARRTPPMGGQPAATAVVFRAPEPVPVSSSFGPMFSGGPRGNPSSTITTDFLERSGEGYTYGDMAGASAGSDAAPPPGPRPRRVLFPTGGLGTGANGGRRDIEPSLPSFSAAPAQRPLTGRPAASAAAASHPHAAWDLSVFGSRLWERRERQGALAAAGLSSAGTARGSGTGLTRPVDALGFGARLSDAGGAAEEDYEEEDRAAGAASASVSASAPRRLHPADIGASEELGMGLWPHDVAVRVPVTVADVYRIADPSFTRKMQKHLTLIDTWAKDDIVPSPRKPKNPPGGASGAGGAGRRASSARAAAYMDDPLEAYKGRRTQYTLDRRPFEDDIRTDRPRTGAAREGGVPDDGTAALRAMRRADETSIIKKVKGPLGKETAVSAYSNPGRALRQMRESGTRPLAPDRPTAASFLKGSAKNGWH